MSIDSIFKTTLLHTIYQYLKVEVKDSNYCLRNCDYMYTCSKRNILLEI
jgi:hypothetical protein